MSEPLRLLVAIAGNEDPWLAEFVSRIAGGRGSAVTLTLLHVVDSGPHELFGPGPEARRSPWPTRSDGARERRVTEAENESAEAVLAAWRERFVALLPEATIETAVRHGRPEREIVEAAGASHADALVLCPRPRAGATEPGPRSVGHVARFVVDHAPVPVILVRDPG